MIRNSARLLFLSVLLLPAFALSQTHIWSHGFGGDVYGGTGRAVALDGSGSVFVAGDFWGAVDFGGGDLVSVGSSDIFLAKYDADGVHQWSQRFGSGSEFIDTGRALAVDGSGDVILTGRFTGTTSFGGGDLVSVGEGDFFIAKYDADGVHQWSRRVGGNTGVDYGLAVTTDGSENVVVTGYFKGTANFGGSDLVSAGETDIFVAKYDASGVHQWSRRFGSPGFDDGLAAAVDGSGNVFLAGGFSGTADFGGGPLVSTGGNDIYLAKYDATGTHQWSQRHGGTGGDAVTSIKIDGSGNVIVTGGFQGTVGLGGGNLVSAGSTDIFVAKYDAVGAHLWSEGFGSPESDYGAAVAIDGSGNLVVTGYFRKITSGAWGALASAGNADVFIAAYDASGTHQWIRPFGGLGSDAGGSVWLDGAGNVVVIGNFDGTVNFGGGALVSAGLEDVFVAKFGPSLTGVGGGTPGHGPAISAYPNPFNPATTIRYTVPSKGRVTVDVYDVSGVRVALLVDEEKTAGTHTANWRGLDSQGKSAGSGVYFAHITHASGVSSYKMVLLK